MLIREGATLVQGAADVLEALHTLSGQPDLPMALAEALPTPALFTEPDARAAVLALLSPTPVPVDELVRQSGLPSAQVASVLLDLELEGALLRHAGARVALG
jgi:DNA processing protein